MATRAELAERAADLGIKVTTRMLKAEIADAIRETEEPESVEVAVQREIESLGVRGTAHAATALALARELDSTTNSATSKSMVARSLNDTLDKLRELAPDDDESDPLDELAARRSGRRSA